MMGIKLRVSDLRPGMVLAEDLIGEDGAVIFPKGKELAEEDIKKLQGMSNLGFVVIKDGNLLREILENTEKEVDDELKKQVRESLRFCCESDKELKEELYLLGVRYRMLLKEKGEVS